MARHTFVFIAALLFWTLVVQCSTQIIDDMENHELVVVKRQADNSTASTAEADTTVSVETSRPPSTVVVSETSTAPPPATDQTSITSASQASSRTAQDTGPTARPSSPNSVTNAPKIASTPTGNGGDVKSADTAQAVISSPSTKIITAISTMKVGNSDVTSTIVRTTVDMISVPRNSQSASPTGSVSGASNSSDDGNSGLTTGQRNTVIGVVVGVGGAILLGGLGIVLWRLRRKKTTPVNDTSLPRRDGSPLAESRREMLPSSADTSPFQATLDQYHKPPGKVNASSNF